MVKLNLKQEMDYWIGGSALILIYPFVRLVARILRRNHSLDQPQHLVFIKMLGGGNLSMLYPTVLALRQKHPGLKISLICNRTIVHFAKTYEMFDEIHAVQDQSLIALFLSGFRLLFWLMRSADVTVDLEVHSRLTTVFTTVALLKNRVGLIDSNSLWRQRLYTHAVYLNASSMNLAEVYDSIAGLFGANEIDPAKTRTQFQQLIGSKPLTEAYTRNFAGKKIITLGIGCSELGRERLLPEDLWAQLMQEILTDSPDSLFVFLGGKEDQALALRLQARLKPADRVVSLCGQVNLATSLRVVQQSALFIGIDSALIHLARILGTPTVSFWGPTSPRYVLRSWPLEEMIFNNNVNCSPCVHFSEAPPCKGQNFCMDYRSQIPRIAGAIVSFLNDGEFPAAFRAPSKPARIDSRVWAYYPDEAKPRTLRMTANYGS